MQALTRPSKRPAALEHRCPRVTLHGASCMLLRGHAGACFVVPCDEYSIPDPETSNEED